MKLVRAMPRVLEAIAILLFGPLLGMLIAILLAGLSLPPDPNFANNGGHVAPGDGILAIFYVCISLVASVPLSILGAGVVLFRSSQQTARQRSSSAVADGSG